MMSDNVVSLANARDQMAGDPEIASAELQREGLCKLVAAEIEALARRAELVNAGTMTRQAFATVGAASVGEIRDALADETMAPVRGVLTRIVRGALANTGLEL